MNRHFSKEDIYAANKHMKNSSSLLVIRKMQIKTTLRYHLMWVRMVIIKKSGNNRWWRGCGQQGTLLLCWWECKLVQPLWKTVWQFLRIQKQKFHLTQQSHYWVYNQRIINPCIIKTHDTYVHCGTVYNSKDLKPTQMPIDDRLDWENVAHIHRGILLQPSKTMSSCPLQGHG